MALRVGFVGLGEMGKWMAINVAKVGFPLTVYDIVPELVKELVEDGAVPADSLVDVASKSDCVLLSLPNTNPI